jgi:insertion element IS1 protein InsB
MASVVENNHSNAKIAAASMYKIPSKRAYSVEVKKLCLKMYLNGMGFRGIARVIDINHTTIINWVEEAGESLSDEPQEDEIPKITEIDELQTFVANKKNKFS